MVDKIASVREGQGFPSCVHGHAGITIDESDIENLESKDKYGSSRTNVRTSDEERQLKLAKKNLLAMAHLTIWFGSEAL